MPGAKATCALSLHFLKVVEVVGVVRVVMEHVPIDQEVCPVRRVRLGCRSVSKVATTVTTVNVLNAKL